MMEQRRYNLQKYPIHRRRWWDLQVSFKGMIRYSIDRWLILDRRVSKTGLWWTNFIILFQSSINLPRFVCFFLSFSFLFCIQKKCLCACMFLLSLSNNQNLIFFVVCSFVIRFFSLSSFLKICSSASHVSFCYILRLFFYCLYSSIECEKTER